MAAVLQPTHASAVPQGGDAATSSAAASRSPAVTSPGKRNAVIVGINSAISSRKLKGAVGDATTLRDALRNYGFASDHMTVLLEAQASRARILSAIG